MAGAVIALTALPRLGDTSRFLPLTVLSTAAGLWLLIAPFGLGYSADAPRATANETVTGAVVVLLGIVGLLLAMAARRQPQDEPTG